MSRGAGGRYAGRRRLLTPLLLTLASWGASAGAAGPQGGKPLLSVTDPAGDAHGAGTSTLPTSPLIRPEALDLRRFEVWPNGKTLTFLVEFGALDNPWNAPSGFSAQTLDIFVDTRRSEGQTQLADLNLQAAGGKWNYHLRVTGFGAAWAAAAPDDPALPPPRVTAEGQTLRIDTALPRGDNLYWVTSSVFSPFSPAGLLRPGGSGPFAVNNLNAKADSTGPVPLDVLAAQDAPDAFNTGQLLASGHPRDPRLWLLWALSLLGLGLSLAATLNLLSRPNPGAKPPEYE